jgi:hypothetical protein
VRPTSPFEDPVVGKPKQRDVDDESVVSAMDDGEAAKASHAADNMSVVSAMDEDDDEDAPKTPVTHPKDERSLHLD